MKICCGGTGDFIGWAGLICFGGGSLGLCWGLKEESARGRSISMFTNLIPDCATAKNTGINEIVYPVAKHRFPAIFLKVQCDSLLMRHILAAIWLFNIWLQNQTVSHATTHLSTTSANFEMTLIANSCITTYMSSPSTICCWAPFLHQQHVPVSREQTVLQFGQWVFVAVCALNISFCFVANVKKYIIETRRGKVDKSNTLLKGWRQIIDNSVFSYNKISFNSDGLK